MYLSCILKDKTDTLYILRQFINKCTVTKLPVSYLFYHYFFQWTELLIVIFPKCSKTVLKLACINVNILYILTLFYEFIHTYILLFV